MFFHMLWLYTTHRRWSWVAARNVAQSARVPF